MPDQHALLAPSAAHRWMRCHPSAVLESREAEKDTVYTREGSVAHKLAETLLRNLLELGSAAVEDSDLLLQRTQEVRDGLWDRTPYWDTLLDCRLRAKVCGADFDDMLRTVNEEYVSVVFGDYLAARAGDPEALLLIEQQLDLAAFIPEGFGSSDAIVIGGGRMTVYDLKYGKGVQVEAKNNEQMMCYALGALVGPGELHTVNEVEAVIIQPRLRHVSRWSIPAQYLLYWGFNDLRINAHLAYQGDGDLVPGDHCRFCAVKHKCRALAQMAEVCTLAAGSPQLLTPEETGRVLGKVALIKTWCTAVEEAALQSALEGRAIPGWKVVEGRSVRTISDQRAAMDILAKAGLSEESYCRPKELKTIGDLERLLRKKGFQEMLGHLVSKPAGKPTLAKDDDPREPYTGAASDFA